MADNSLKISYKIYLEAEDISQSRISSTASYESDMDDFTLRLYIDEKVEEEACSSPECAEGFLENIAEFLDAVAAAHSYLDMEGSFSISYHGVEDTFRFRSEAGSDLCDIE